MDGATGTLIGTAIGSAATLITTYLTGFFTLNKERFTAQMALDKERQAAEFALQKEREARSAQETSELRKWQRDQLAASLTNSALIVNMYISMILGRTLEDYQKDPEVIKTSAEMQRQIVLLLLHYPEKSNPEFVELSEVSKKTTWNAVVNDDTAWKLRDKIIALAATLGLWTATSER